MVKQFTINKLFEYDNDRHVQIEEILLHVKEMKKRCMPEADILPIPRNACTEFPDNDKLREVLPSLMTGIFLTILKSGCLRIRVGKNG